MSATLANNFPSNQNKATSLNYIPKMNREVTFIGFGALEIGRDWGIGLGDTRQHPDEVTAKNVIETVIQQNINVIDTASSYHLSEQRLGKYLPALHSNILLNTKVGESNVFASNQACKIPAYDNIYCNLPAASYNFSSKAIIRDVAESQQRLKQKTLDIVFIHFDDNPKPVIDRGEALATLKKLKSEGKIRYIGASLDDVEQTTRIINSNEYDAIEVEYSLLNRAQEKNIALAHQKGLGVFIRGGLGTGLLTAKVKPYLADPNLPFRKEILQLLSLTHGDYDELTALALAFLYDNKNINTIIIGSKNPLHFMNDINLLNHFNQPKLLIQAKAITTAKKYHFTDSIDNYFLHLKS